MITFLCCLMGGALLLCGVCGVAAWLWAIIVKSSGGSWMDEIQEKIPFPRKLLTFLFIIGLILWGIAYISTSAFPIRIPSLLPYHLLGLGSLIFWSFILIHYKKLSRTKPSALALPIGVSLAWLIYTGYSLGILSWYAPSTNFILIQNEVTRATWVYCGLLLLMLLLLFIPKLRGSFSGLKALSFLGLLLMMGECLWLMVQLYTSFRPIL